MNEKQSSTCLCSGGRKHLATHISKVASRPFFPLKCLIQNPAQAINFKFPAMSSPRHVIFSILVRIRLPAHERASGWSQSGGSHNSDVDRLANQARVGPAASEHLHVALAVGRRQLSHWFEQSALISCMIFKSQAPEQTPVPSPWTDK